ncbi:hypothetical protein BRADI_3g10985v3 [Brachypodium distachyon]|uniref:Uncharacterized protein n=1 Tax=Brachypodium distachyon TaxID=15368 RepID=A0A2K2CWJ8_BRADI|nr:hypothetical protein BRADI_3g10985v3 [Brachypodium distachyon]
MGAWWRNGRENRLEEEDEHVEIRRRKIIVQSAQAIQTRKLFGSAHVNQTKILVRPTHKIWLEPTHPLTSSTKHTLIVPIWQLQISSPFDSMIFVGTTEDLNP